MLQTQEIEQYHKLLHRKIEEECFFPKIVRVEYIKDFILKLTFNDGLLKVVDFYPLIRGKRGLFEDLKNQDYFKKVFIDNELETVCWKNNIDFSPEFLYHYTT